MFIVSPELHSDPSVLFFSPSQTPLPCLDPSLLASCVSFLANQCLSTPSHSHEYKSSESYRRDPFKIKTEQNKTFPYSHFYQPPAARCPDFCPSGDLATFESSHWPQLEVCACVLCSASPCCLPLDHTVPLATPSWKMGEMEEQVGWLRCALSERYTLILKTCYKKLQLSQYF